MIYRPKANNPAVSEWVMQAWRGIQYRCNNPKCPQWNNYGGRGIQNRITPEQLQDVWDRDNAKALHKPSIDRIDNDGHYEPGNVRFIEQRDNRAARTTQRKLDALHARKGKKYKQGPLNLQ